MSRALAQVYFFILPRAIFSEAYRSLQAFPWNTAPRHLQRDRDSVFGRRFREGVANMGIDEVLTAARSPWQNPYVERLIGSIRRELLDHVIVIDESHLRRLLRSYFSYYHRWPTHLCWEL